MSQGIWQLFADPDELDTASQSWVDVSSAIDTSSDDMNAASAKALKKWEGEAATSYDVHRKKMVGDLDSASTLAGAIGSLLAASAGTVRVAQGRLDIQWSRVVAFPSKPGPYGGMVFDELTPEQVATVNDSVAQAQEIRDGLETQVGADAKTLDGYLMDWTAIGTHWKATAEGAPSFDVPSDDDDTGVVRLGDRVVVNGGGGDDDITVHVDPNTGETIVEVNGTFYRFPEGTDVTIRGGDGNDTITIPPDMDIDFTILGSDGDDVVSGGAGDDTILGNTGRDRVTGGAGDDRASGGSDRDYLDGQDGDDRLRGGSGDDTVYGLGGDDTLTGGSGKDYLEAGTGDDSIAAGSGDDTISGGRDDDTLFGNGGDDVTYAGEGDDESYGGGGDDTTYAETGDSVGGDTETRVNVEIPDTARFINIQGSPEFIARVEADLDMLRSSPTGQQMLEKLQEMHDDSGPLFRENLTITEYTGDNNYASDGPLGGNEIKYNPTRDSAYDDRPPIFALYHEMAHVYDFMDGNFDGTEYTGDDTRDADKGTAQGERTAVGLPVDHDHDPSTPEIVDPDHPEVYTENGLRDEAGWIDRPSYGH